MRHVTDIDLSKLSSSAGWHKGKFLWKYITPNSYKSAIAVVNRKGRMYETILVALIPKNNYTDFSVVELGYAAMRRDEYPSINKDDVVALLITQEVL